MQLVMACSSVTTSEMILNCGSISRRCGATVRAPKHLATLNHKEHYYINSYNHQNKVFFYPMTSLAPSTAVLWRHQKLHTY
jgi:hypothetical protein